MKKLNIGFLSYWGTNRGLPAVTLCYAKMIHDVHNVFILKQGNNSISPEFESVNAHVTEYPDYIVKREVFKNWLIRNKIDAVVFNEYKQWNSDPNELVKLCKELKIKTYGILVLEKLKKEQTVDYDKLICETHTAEKVFRTMRVRNFTYVPYSLDLNEFPVKKKIKNEKFTFFHPAGMGGVLDRKNTDNVVKAFKRLNRDDCKLIITSQKPLNIESSPLDIELINKNLTRQELIDIYYKSDVTVLPSKWETIGIPILESMACGTPVITTNVPPMNELVIPNSTGFICTPTLTRYDGIEINVAEVDDIEISHKMEMCFNPLIYGILSKYSRNNIEQIYNLEKNKVYLLKLLEDDFNGK
jgi:glycosyltransferase involved in cell wall biosynthesis